MAEEGYKQIRALYTSASQTLMYTQITHGSYQNADSDPEVGGEAGESLSNKLPRDPDAAGLWATLLGSKVLRLQCYFPTKNVWSFTH